MIFLIALLLLIQVPALYAQNGHIKNHELSGNEMDFWVGEWNLEWTINGEKGRGINSVIKTLGGAVIHEHFSGQEGPYAGFKGEGFTTFNPRAKTFFQTWVDNGGGYLDFTFQREGEKYIFVREADTNQYSVKSRMVFYDIKPSVLPGNGKNLTTHLETGSYYDAYFIRAKKPWKGSISNSSNGWPGDGKTADRIATKYGLFLKINLH